MKSCPKTKQGRVSVVNDTGKDRRFSVEVYGHVRLQEKAERKLKCARQSIVVVEHYSNTSYIVMDQFDRCCVTTNNHYIVEPLNSQAFPCDERTRAFIDI